MGLVTVETVNASAQELEDKYHLDNEDETNTIIKTLYDLRRELSSSMLECLGVTLDSKTCKNDAIVYNNGILKNNSNVSILNASILQWFLNIEGNFIMTENMKAFVNYIYSNGDGYKAGLLLNIPQTMDELDRGKKIVEGLTEIGCPAYSAIALAGDIKVEAGWPKIESFDQPFNIYNKLEAKGIASDKFAAGKAHCGESFFGLTNWAQKEKCIRDSVYTKAIAEIGDLSEAGYTRWFDKNNKPWIASLPWSDQFRLFISYIRTCCPSYCAEYLLADKMVTPQLAENIAATAFLFKAGPGETHGNTLFERAVFRSENVYTRCNSRTYNSKQQSCLGVALVSSWILSQYIKGEIKSNDDVAYPFEGTPSADHSNLKVLKNK